MQEMQKLPQVVLTEVGGLATAAGCQLVATSDMAIAASSASFATPGVRIGLFCTTPGFLLLLLFLTFYTLLTIKLRSCAGS